jgi:hypothetical protein
MKNLKARRTPTSNHPSDPPKIPSSLEVLYYAVDSDSIAPTLEKYQNRIVTSQILYKPGLLASARVTFEGTRWELHHQRDVIRTIPFPDLSQIGNWDENLITNWENANIRTSSEGVCFYEVDASFDFSPGRFETLQEEYIQFLISSETLAVIYNPQLKICKKLEETEEQFYARCLDQVRENYTPELRIVKDTVLRQEERLKEKLTREIREHGDEQLALQATTGREQNVPQSRTDRLRKRKKGTPTHEEELGAHESMANREDIQRQLIDIQKSKALKMGELEENLVALARQREEDIFRLNHGNVRILRFALVWLPFTEFIVELNDGGRRTEQIKSF